MLRMMAEDHRKKHPRSPLPAQADAIEPLTMDFLLDFIALQFQDDQSRVSEAGRMAALFAGMFK